MKKKMLLLLAGVCLSLTSMPVYAEEEMESETEIEFDVTLDAYWMSDGMLSIEEDDWEGGTMLSEYGSAGYVVYEPGTTIGEMLTESGVFSLDVINENDVFEGWMECEIILTEDEDGFEWEEYALVDPETLYTTEELMELEITKDVMYVVKWGSIPAEDYFKEEEEYVTLASISVDANGGMMYFEAEDPYESDFNVASLEAGQTISEVLDGQYEEEVFRIEKEGAEFAGWTLYQCETIEWMDEPEEGEGILCIPYGEDMYTVLTESEVCEEQVTLEKLADFVCEDTNYYMLANWK